MSVLTLVSYHTLAPTMTWIEKYRYLIEQELAMVIEGHHEGKSALAPPVPALPTCDIT